MGIKRLRLRLFSTAGRLAVSGRRTVLHLQPVHRWAGLVRDAVSTLRVTTSTDRPHHPGYLPDPEPREPSALGRPVTPAGQDS